MKKRLIAIIISMATLFASLPSLSFSAQASSDIIVSVDTTADRKIISPLIYGINDIENADVTTTAIRQGGNRYTGYNWENNFSSAGSDWQQSSDTYLIGSVPSDLKSQPGAPALWLSRKASDMKVPYTMATVQMAGYVSADSNGTVSESELAPSARWKEVKASKDASFSLTPNTSDNYVYIDEYVNYLVSKLGDSTTNTGINGYNLDNEPGLWADTHPRIHKDKVTCKEIVDKSIEYAKAIKNVDSNAEIYGLALYGFNAYKNLQGAPDWDSTYKNQYDWFISYYLDQMAKAEQENGKRLIDVIDMHYYSEAQGGGQRVTLSNADITNTACNQARVQAPRTLYDPNYIEDSWIGQWGGNKIPIIPVIQASIDKYYPGTKLSFTEYNFGGGKHVSGAIAQADALGAFATNGVYLATLWPLDKPENIPYLLSGINIYTNYDGNGAMFGNTLVKSQTSDINTSTSYASINNGDESKVTLLLTNKNSTESTTATIKLTNGSGIDYSSAKVYGITKDSSDIKQLKSISEITNNTFTYEIPAFSVVQIEINSNVSEDVKGDINNNKIINVEDLKATKKYVLNQMNLNADEANRADVNSDGIINSIDVTLLKNLILNNKSTDDYGTHPDTSAIVYADFRKGASPSFEAADGWSNGQMFDCIWRGTNVQFNNNSLNLIVDKGSSPEYNYSGAEYRSKNYYGYGYYEVSMIPIKNNGIDSSFFVYTGPYDGDPWDEIDIEFLGKDTTKVQFNYFTNGVGNHEYMYDLGFDATEVYHTYGFNWQKDSITWYVDDKPVHTVTSNIPTNPGKIMMNVWPGISVDSWLNPYDGTTPLTAKYQWVTYSENTK